MKNFNLQDSAHLLVPGSILIGSIIVAGSIMFGARTIAHSGSAAATIPVQDQKIAVDSSKVNAVGEPIVGDPKAKLTIAYWFDYQCPFCKKLDDESVSKIVDEYVKAGKAKIVFKDFQFLGPDSQRLGLVARAVWNIAPDKFFAWHRAIFVNQGRENSGWATTEAIRSISASVLGGDLADRAISLADKDALGGYARAISADRTEGSKFGVNSTPTLVIGHKTIVGAEPYETIKAAIDAALADK